MLVLTQREGEVVRLGDAEVHIMKISGRRVRLGFKAPLDVDIVRTTAKNQAISPKRAAALGKMATPVEISVPVTTSTGDVVATVPATATETEAATEVAETVT